jgi:hypothetical protein
MQEAEMSAERLTERRESAFADFRQVAISDNDGSDGICNDCTQGALERSRLSELPETYSGVTKRDYIVLASEKKRKSVLMLLVGACLALLGCCTPTGTLLDKANYWLGSNSIQASMESDKLGDVTKQSARSKEEKELAAIRDLLSFEDLDIDIDIESFPYYQPSPEESSAKATTMESTLTTNQQQHRRLDEVDKEDEDGDLDEDKEDTSEDIDSELGNVDSEKKDPNIIDDTLLKPNPPVRLLYIVTSLAEFNTGTRSTIAGSDRLVETVIPVIAESVMSMMAQGYHVDVFLVCHYTLTPDRQAMIQAVLPKKVRFDVWNDATPIGYDTSKETFTKVMLRFLQLARQHRFVVKDRLAYYDHFCCFEDDMIITGAQVTHFREVTSELYRLRQEAPDDLPDNPSKKEVTDQYYGVMTKGQLKRMIPGFIRVEVLLDEEKYPAQSDTGPVPVDLEFDSTSSSAAQSASSSLSLTGNAVVNKTRTIDPIICCEVGPSAVRDHIPASTTDDKVVLWETNIKPLGIRQMPKGSWLDWVVLQRGPMQGNLKTSETIGDYWTNRHKDYYGNDGRPTPMEFKYINNQGGWMATREQLWEWHTEICPGGFLPPYEAPHYRYDGLDMRNVEWYSGAMQLSTLRHACNMQRIVLLEPGQFSKSLLYHSSNNKQRQLRNEGLGESFVKANTLLGQLNTLKKRAEKEMVQEQGKRLSDESPQ